MSGRGLRAGWRVIAIYPLVLCLFLAGSARAGSQTSADAETQSETASRISAPASGSIPALADKTKESSSTGLSAPKAAILSRPVVPSTGQGIALSLMTRDEAVLRTSIPSTISPRAPPQQPKS